MGVKRKKPTVTVTLDSDVVQWLKEEAARNRCNSSQFVNQLLAKKMEEEEAGKAVAPKSMRKFAG